MCAAKRLVIILIRRVTTSDRRWHSPQNAKADSAGDGQRARNHLKPGEQGTTRWHPVTAQGSKPEFDYGYERNLCLKRPHLERTTKRQGWCETVGSQPFTQLAKRSLMRPYCSGYRGINHRLLSGILGVYPTGVKKEPTVKRTTYH